MDDKTIGFALCGSFCTHAQAIGALEQVKARFARVVPIVSQVVADTDTRFGKAHDLMREMERICDHRVISTVKGAEPIGPQKLLDLLIICPCTGNTLGKLAAGVTDTSVTMAAKAHLRNCRPCSSPPPPTTAWPPLRPASAPFFPENTSTLSPSAKTTRKRSQPPWLPTSPR